MYPLSNHVSGRGHGKPHKSRVVCSGDDEMRNIRRHDYPRGRQHVWNSQYVLLLYDHESIRSHVRGSPHVAIGWWWR